MVALAYPEPKRGIHSQLKFSTDVDKGDLSRARAICRWAPEWTAAARAGATFKRCGGKSTDVCHPAARPTGPRMNVPKREVFAPPHSVGTFSRGEFVYDPTAPWEALRSGMIVQRDGHWIVSMA